ARARRRNSRCFSIRRRAAASRTVGCRSAPGLAVRILVPPAKSRANPLFLRFCCDRERDRWSSGESGANLSLGIRPSYVDKARCPYANCGGNFLGLRWRAESCTTYRGLAGCGTLFFFCRSLILIMHASHRESLQGEPHVAALIHEML